MAKRRDKREDLLNYDRGEEAWKAYLAEEEAFKERRRQEEERKRLHPDFSNVEASSQTTERTGSLGPLDRLDALAQRKMTEIGNPIVDALQGGVQSSAAGLANLAADPEAAPGFTGDLMRSGIDVARQYVPEYAAAVDQGREQAASLRDRLLAASEANRQQVKSGLDQFAPGFSRGTMEAVTDVAGSPVSLLSIVGGPAAAGITAADVYNQEYLNMVQQGMDPATARQRALAMAGAEGGVAAIPAGKLFERLGLGRVGRDLLRSDAVKVAGRTVKSVFGEATEEGATEIVQGGIDKLIEENTTSEKNRTIAAAQTVDFWNQVWRATKAGAVGGASLGGLHSSLEVSAEAGRLASQARRSQRDQRNALVTEQRDAAERQARIADETARAWKERENQIPIQTQEQQDQMEADYRNMERQREVERLRRGAGLDQMPGPMQAALQQAQFKPVTAEDIARERQVNAQREQQDANVTEQLKVELARKRQEEGNRAAQGLIEKDNIAIKRKAASQRGAARRKAMDEIVTSTRNLPAEERANAIRERTEAWDAANPIETFVQNVVNPVTQPRVQRTRTGQRRPVPTTPATPAPVTMAEEAPVDAPKRDLAQLKAELNMPSAPSTPATSGVTADQAMETLVRNVGKADAKKVLKLVADGNAVILDSETDVPPGVAPAGAGAFYDGKKTYIIANKVDPKNVMGDLLKYTAHEVKHAADVSGNKTLKATLGQFIGADANSRINRKIEALADSGDRYAQAVVRMAREGSTPETYSLELPAYWSNLAQEQRESTGPMKRITNDIVSAVRTKYKSMRGDADINLKDVGYLSRKLLEETGLSGERLTGDINKPLGTIAGKTAKGIKAAREAGLTYTSVDGNEKFLFSDQEAALRPDNTGWKADLVTKRPVPVSQVLEHPEFYKQYPEGANLKIAVDSRLKEHQYGYMSTADNTIYINQNILEPEKASFLTDVIIHEMQHYVQDIEGHARGGTPVMFFTKDDAQIVDKYNSAMTKFDGLWNLVSNNTQRRQVFGNGILQDFVARVVDNIRNNKITKIEGLSDVVVAVESYEGAPQQARLIGKGLRTTLDAVRQYGPAVNAIFKRQNKQYNSLLGEVEARFTAENRGMAQKDLPVNPEVVPAETPGAFDTKVEDTLIARGGTYNGERWTIDDTRGNRVIDSKTVAMAGLEADPRANITPAVLGSAASRFQKPSNRVTNTINDAIKIVAGQLRTYGNLGEELGVMKENADGEAALHAHRAMNYFNWLNRGMDRMARDGVKAGNYKNKAEGQAAIRELVRTKMDDIAAIEDETRREAALAGFIRQHPELEGLMAAVQEVRQLSRELLKQQILTTPNPTNEELRLMNTIMDNSFRYTTQMYAAFQGPAGRIHSQQIIDEYDRAVQLIAKNKNVPESLKKSYNTYKNALKYLIDNDLTIPDIDELDGSSTDKLKMLYDTWIGDATRAAITTKEQGIRDGLTHSQADQLVRDTLVAALDAKRPSVEESDYVGKGRDLILGMLELSNEGGPFASYYRGFKQDRSILERRTGLPQEIKDLFGEITDPATRLAVTIAKQGELAARTRMLLDMRDNGNGKWVIPSEEAGLPGKENFTTTLKGKNYGPLDGWRTTPEIAAAISDNLELFTTLGDAMAQSYQNSQPFIDAVARSGIKTVKGLAAWQKVLTVVFDLYNMGTNFAGSFIALAANGLPVKGFGKGAKTAMQIVADSVYTSSGDLPKGFEDAVKYGILDSARVQEIRKTPQKYVKDLISVEPKVSKGVRKGLSLVRRGTVETFAMSDAWVKIVAFENRQATLKSFYEAEGVTKSDDDIKKEAADHIKNTNITYARTPPLVRNLESIGITTFMPYFVSVPRAITYNLVLGIQDTVRATAAGTPKGKAIMMQSGLRRIAGAYAASAGLIYLTKAVAAAFNDDDDDEVQKMKNLMYPDARFADSFFLGKDEGGNPMFARFSRVDPFGPVNDILRIAIDDDITPAEKRRHMAEMLRDMIITNRVVVSGTRLAYDLISDDVLKDKKTKIERMSPAGSEAMKEVAMKIPGIDYNDANSVLEFMDSFTPGILDMFDPKNRGIAEPKGQLESALGALVTYSGGRMDVADPGLASWRVGNDVKMARAEGRSRLAQGLSAGRSPEALAKIFLEEAAKEQTALQEAARVYEGMTGGIGLTPHKAMEYLKEDAKLTASDIANIRQGRVNQELEEWLNTGTRMLSKSSLTQRADKGISESDKKVQEENRKAFIKAMRALGYKVREN